MNCPKCGYAMGPFDVECERCKRLGEPKPPEQAMADWRERMAEVDLKFAQAKQKEAEASAEAARQRMDDAKVKSLQAQANFFGALSSLSCLVGLILLGLLVVFLLVVR
jgi:hypothetical protein